MTDDFFRQFLADGFKLPGKKGLVIMEESLKGLLFGASVLAFLVAGVTTVGILKACEWAQDAAVRRNFFQPNVVLLQADEDKYELLDVDEYALPDAGCGKIMENETE